MTNESKWGVGQRVGVIVGHYGGYDAVPPVVRFTTIEKVGAREVKTAEGTRYMSYGTIVGAGVAKHGIWSRQKDEAICTESEGLLAIARREAWEAKARFGKLKLTLADELRKIESRDQLAEWLRAKLDSTITRTP